ncbi:RTA1 like protein-domain-containing protein [Talaromyces proteolyticus]|uniref:RTA1 like protein-domain-containing protein n=1 Tax=Talaromyces proteolyticus TaxID=1131652 RepID=A0AAD4KRE0_9EURO|nr:RTA1 like protein-domain-containing protein [Talaromyces proteolyticus]KAH8693932.1 RTA1 like protein-domain-containing protein [Talaromyces proteolyticus]
MPSPTTTTAADTTGTSTSTASATCISIAPGKNGYLPPEACGNLILYEPSLGAAIFFCVLYGLALLTHIGLGIKFKKGYTWVISMGAAWELIAFIMRSLMALHQNVDSYNTVYTIFFLLAPLWVNAFLYMTLGRMIYFFVEEKRLGGLSAKRYGVLFVWLDIIAFIVQLVGAAFTTQTDVPVSTIMLGVHIYMGGIGLQEFFILVFTCLFVVLHRRMLQEERLGLLNMEKARRGSLNWRKLFYAIYFSLFMITIRIIFRLAQYARGTDVNNPVLTHEWYEYMWDAVPIFLALLALIIFHPGRVLVGPDSEFPHISRKEKKRLKREKKEAKRAQKEAKKAGGRWGWRSKGEKGRDSIAFESLSGQEDGTVAPGFYDQYHNGAHTEYRPAHN